MTVGLWIVALYLLLLLLLLLYAAIRWVTTEAILLSGSRVASKPDASSITRRLTLETPGSSVLPLRFRSRESRLRPGGFLIDQSRNPSPLRVAEGGGGLSR
jgi:hypothetical protein